MSSDCVLDVHSFQAKFNSPSRALGKKPNRTMLQFRIKFLLEELDEFACAARKSDLPQMTDALVDLVYVAIGTAWQLQLPFELAWREVHAANMCKERAQKAGDSKRGVAYDIVKPGDWVPPNLSQFFSQADLDLKIVAQSHDQHDLIEYLNQLKEREKHEQDTREDTR